ncbi:MAG: hypothetical protein NWQ46_05490 [Spirosomaceae bacterium]|nr:hypothetical protein [Spirosomataceae bacterium]
MRNKYIFLVVAILALFNFVGFMTETEAPDLFGYQINIWVYRGAWLFMTIYFATRYFNMRKAEKK